MPDWHHAVRALQKERLRKHKLFAIYADILTKLRRPLTSLDAQEQRITTMSNGDNDQQDKNNGDSGVGNGSSDGGGSTTAFQTMRGRNYPTIRQFTVFMENRLGQFMEVVRRFEGTGIKIVAFSINDSAECAFVRFLVDQPERGREILERAGLSIIESDLIGVELPDSKQPFLEVCSALLQAEINIVQSYPLIARPYGKPVVALMVDNTEFALETLQRKKFRLITEGDLLDESYD